VVANAVDLPGAFRRSAARPADGHVSPTAYLGSRLGHTSPSAPSGRRRSVPRSTPARLRGRPRGGWYSSRRRPFISGRQARCVESLQGGAVAPLRFPAPSVRDPPPHAPDVEIRQASRHCWRRSGGGGGFTRAGRPAAEPR
jgi:hypothetical protein